MVITAIIVSSGHKGTTTTTPATATPAGNTTFEQIGSFRPAAFQAGLQAESYYVANPTKNAIRQFCDQQKSERFATLKEYDQNLNISFYDDKNNTPNYTNGYDPSDTTYDTYRIADYVINPVGGGTDQVTFSKDIPE